MDEIPDLVMDIDEAEVSELVSKFHPTIEDKSSEKSDEPMSETNEEEQTRKIPITIITGYLGSGKSTLLEQIALKGNKKLAVILNEFGDSTQIEKSINIKDGDKNYEEWLDLGNGCLCCSVKDIGVTAIEKLVSSKKNNIDYILLETTGVADPAPIAKMFWLDDALSSNVYIDGVITVVDSEHIITCLDDIGGHWHREQNLDIDSTTGLTTAHLQVALADVILVNKVDKLKSESQVKGIHDRLGQINSIAPIYETKFGDIDLDSILDLHAFEYDSKLNSSITFATNSSFHDDRVGTITINFPFISEETYPKIESFLQYVLWENIMNNKPVEIHRTKGILIEKSTHKVSVIQGVRDTYDIISGELTEGLNTCKLVLIGKGLNLEDVKSEFNRFTGIQDIQ